MSDKDELPYMVLTSRKYEVYGPEDSGEIELAKVNRYGDYEHLFFTADDLRMMLDRIERGKK